MWQRFYLLWVGLVERLDHLLGLWWQAYSSCHTWHSASLMLLGHHFCRSVLSQLVWSSLHVIFSGLGGRVAWQMDEQVHHAHGCAWAAGQTGVEARPVTWQLCCIVPSWWHMEVRSSRLVCRSCSPSWQEIYLDHLNQWQEWNGIISHVRVCAYLLSRLVVTT